MNLAKSALCFTLLLGAGAITASNHADAQMQYSDIKLLHSGWQVLAHSNGWDKAWWSVGTNTRDSRALPGKTNVGPYQNFICVGNDACDDVYLQAFNECYGPDYTWTAIEFVPDPYTVIQAPSCTSWGYPPIQAGLVGIGKN